MHVYSVYVASKLSVHIIIYQASLAWRRSLSRAQKNFFNDVDVLFNSEDEPD